jgi:hypothetical protein
MARVEPKRDATEGCLEYTRPMSGPSNRGSVKRDGSSGSKNCLVLSYGSKSSLLVGAGKPEGFALRAPREFFFAQKDCKCAGLKPRKT